MCGDTVEEGVELGGQGREKAGLGCLEVGFGEEVEVLEYIEAKSVLVTTVYGSIMNQRGSGFASDDRVGTYARGL